MSSAASSESACERTDTYSPAAIDIAPATRPAMPATITLACVACAAATPSTRLAVETIPSFAPSTAARNQPMRSVRCRSLWRPAIAAPPCPKRDYGVSRYAVRRVVSAACTPAIGVRCTIGSVWAGTDKHPAAPLRVVERLECCRSYTPPVLGQPALEGRPQDIP